jgi:hypothetical protein
MYKRSIRYDPRCYVKLTYPKPLSMLSRCAHFRIHKECGLCEACDIYSRTPLETPLETPVETRSTQDGTSTRYTTSTEPHNSLNLMIHIVCMSLPTFSALVCSNDCVVSSSGGRRVRERLPAFPLHFPCLPPPPPSLCGQQSRVVALLRTRICICFLGLLL